MTFFWETAEINDPEIRTAHMNHDNCAGSRAAAAAAACYEFLFVSVLYYAVVKRPFSRAVRAK